MKTNVLPGKEVYVIDEPQGPCVAVYQMMDTRTQINADDERLIEKIDDLLGFCRVLPSDSQPDITFFLRHVGETEISLPEIVKDQGRLVYGGSSFTFWEHGLHRWLEVPNRALVSADLSTNEAVAFVTTKAIDSPWLVGQYVFFPIWSQMLKQAGLFHLHAACVSDDQGLALLFPGPSGCGKTTLALNLIRYGFNFLNDDTIFIRQQDQQLSITGFPEPLKIRAQTAKIFPEFGLTPGDDNDSEWGKWQVNPQDFFTGCSRVTDVEPKAMIFPRFGGQERSNITPLNRADALASLLRFSLFMADPAKNGENFRILGELVDQCPCYSLETGTNNEETAVLMDELLKKMEAA